MSKEKKVIYAGLFLNEQISSNLLAVRDQHVTFGFKSSVDPELIKLTGKEVEITLVGYGNDGINEGFLVEIPEEMLPLYNGNSIQHVTVGVGGTGKPVDTWKLGFKPVPPTTVKATVGYFNGKVVK